MDFIALVKEFGLSVAMLIVAVYALYRFFNWVGPRVDRIVEAHVGFLNKTNQAQEESVVVQKKQADTLAAVLTSVEERTADLEAMDKHHRLTHLMVYKCCKMLEMQSDKLGIPEAKPLVQEVERRFEEAIENQSDSVRRQFARSRDHKA